MIQRKEKKNMTQKRATSLKFKIIYTHKTKKIEIVDWKDLYAASFQAQIPFKI